MGGIGANAPNPASVAMPGAAGGGGLGTGVAPGVPAGQVPKPPGAGFARMAASAVSGNAVQALDVAQKALVRSFSNPNADPTQALFGLSRMLEEFKPEVLMPALSPEKQAQFKGRPVREMAEDMMEDVATDWAVKRLAAAKANEFALTEEEVVRVLQRSLEATQTVERMLQKLSALMHKADLPPDFYQRIQQELRWTGLPDEQKRKALLDLHRYNAAEFKRLQAYVKDLMGRSRFDEATSLVTHYFAILDLGEREIQPAELARAPELLQTVARLQTREFMQAMATRLTQALFDDQLRGWHHIHVSNCLATVAHSMAPYEDFESVQKIAQDLEKSRLRGPELHHDCCMEALGNLLGPRSIERLIELYAQKREAQRMVLSIVKLMGRPGIEKVFQRLEDEKKASNRMALIRLIGQTGPGATEVARQRLKDERWYVVRNACFVLADLNDPKLMEELREVLRHPDERVQQAALNVISKHAVPGRAEVVASSLLHLKPLVLDKALDELRFWKSPEGITGLEQFITQGGNRPQAQEKAMHALLAVPEDAPVEALARIVVKQENPVAVRRMAIARLGKSSAEAAYQSLSEVASRVKQDKLAAEAQAALEIEG